MYSQEILDSIQRALPIDTVIREYVELTGEGQRLRGVCPFHTDSHPSFYVYTDKGFFRCYGCNAGGNQFTFIKLLLDVKFPEAVRHLAQKAGISLPDLSENSTPPCNIEPLERAAQLYEKTLWDHPEVLGYLRTRGLKEQTIRTFRLGYAPPGNVITRTFTGTYSPEDLLQVDLIRKSKHHNSQYYDTFRARLMFPIFDTLGRVVAFGGRVVDDEKYPKYLNTSAHPMFHKGQLLYGIHAAKDAIRKTGKAHLTEGYLDFLAMWQHGLQNTLGTMGTALTEYHLRQIQRYTKNVILVFDADPAGMKAVLRTLDLFLTSGVEGRAVVLPKGEDPDSAIRKDGVEKFRTYVDQAPLLLDFVRDRIVERYDLSQAAQQIECAKKLLPIIVKIRDLVERNVQITRTADILKISDRALLQEFKKASEVGKIQFSQTPTRKQMTIPRLEQYLIKALIKDKRLIPEVQETFAPTELSHPISQKILEELFVYGDKTDFEAKIFDTFQGAEVQQELSELLMKTEEIQDPVRTVWDCINTLRQKRFDQATLDVSWKVRNAQEKKHGDVLDTFLEQKNKDLLRKKHNNLKKKGKI